MICAALLLSSYWGHAARRYPPDDQHQGRAPNATWDDHVPGLPHRDDFDREVRKRFDLPHTRANPTGVPSATST